MRNFGTRVYHKIERVHFGAGTFNKIAEEVTALGGTRVVALVSTTLRANTDLVERLEASLGARLVGVIDGIPAHTHRGSVLKVAEEARALSANLVVTLGGGSVMDCGQMLRLCLHHNIRNSADMDRYRIVVARDGTRTMPSYEGPKIPQIAVATTLSAAEFNPMLGCTDTERGVKDIYAHRDLAAQVIILDPEVCVTTPVRLWSSTGIRALDHCIETLLSPALDAYSLGPALQGIKLLAEALPATMRDPSDLEARLNGLLGAWCGADHNMAFIPMGASHGIGHMLGGSLGMAHGDTSCVMLPAVLAFNHDATAARQAMVSDAMGRPGVPAATVVRDFIEGLGLSTRLSTLGIDKSGLARVAKAAMEAHYLHTNPRPIKSEAEVMELLLTAY